MPEGFDGLGVFISYRIAGKRVRGLVVVISSCCTIRRSVSFIVIMYNCQFWFHHLAAYRTGECGSYRGIGLVVVVSPGEFSLIALVVVAVFLV